jgi:hypothetical protein
MVIGVKCADQLAANHIPVMFSKGNYLRRVLFFYLMKKLEIPNLRLSKGNRMEACCCSLNHP